MRKFKPIHLAVLMALVGFIVLLGRNAHSPSVKAEGYPPGLRAPSQPGPMPAFRLPGLDRPELDSSALLGKVVVLRFWATW